MTEGAGPPLSLLVKPVPKNFLDSSAAHHLARFSGTATILDLMVSADDLEEEPADRPIHRRLLVAVPALVLVGLIAYGTLTRVEPPGAAGTDAPAFELPTLDGSTLSSEDLEGQPVVLNFFASWCVPCREEAPLLEKLWREHRDDGIRFVGVNVQDNELGAAAFVKEFGISYPVVLDPGDELGSQLDVVGLPQTFFIDDEGRFLATETGPRLGESRDTVVLGAISEATLRAKVNELLERAEA